MRTIVDLIAIETTPSAVDGRTYEHHLRWAVGNVKAWCVTHRTDLLDVIPSAPLPDVIDQTFASMYSQVDEWYAAVGGTVVPTTLLLEQRTDMTDGYFVAGEFSRGKRILRVFVDPDPFDWRSAVALAVVMMHELVCHAGARSGSAGRQVFSEALMDQASVSYVRRWASAAALPRGFVGQLRETATVLQNTRRATGVYVTGRFARSVLSELIERDPRRASRDAEILTDRLLLAINAFEGEIESKDRLAEALGTDDMTVETVDLLAHAALARRSERDALLQALLAAPG